MVSVILSPSDNSPAEALLLRASANSLNKDFEGMADDLEDFFHLDADWIKVVSFLCMCSL